MRALPLLLLSACSDYEYTQSVKHAGAEDTARGPRTGQDEDSPGDDTGPPPDDTDPPPTDTDPSTDGCFEPEDGYAMNPAARIFTTDSTTPVTLTFVASDTSYDNDLYLDAPESLYLCASRTTAPGTTGTVGPYAVDSELIFGISVSNTGQHFQSGPSSRNSDGVNHVAVTYEGACSWLIGFEDMTGGGDSDFNDVVIRVQGMLRQED